jgi:hypothetical protein
VLADGGPHGVGVAAGGHDVVTGLQGRAGELDAHAAPVISQVFVMALTVDPPTGRKEVL